MTNLVSLRTATAVLVVILLGLFARTTDKRQAANIEGYVFEKCADSRLIGPIGGAVVSTSVDATTATTDITGHFHMLTTHPVFSDEFYEVSVRSGAVVVDDNFLLPPITSTVSVTFVLSPPESVAAHPKSSKWGRAFPPGRFGTKLQRTSRW